MKIRLLLLSGLLFAMGANAQNTPVTGVDSSPFIRNTFMATASVGFINSYRSDYTVPVGFEKGVASGFTPIHARFEYAVSNKVSIALNTGFNTTTFNAMRLDEGYNGTIKRPVVNRWRMFYGGVSAWYHFGHLLHSEKLDPFIGGGICLNNIVESASPSGDSTIRRKTHSATPTLKLGMRYYITPKFSVYADAGYDRLSAVSVGMSCRFFSRKKDTQIPASGAN
jgi:hypothetical protein